MVFAKSLRMGKTMNLTMFQAFLNQPDLFAGISLPSEPTSCIYLSLPKERVKIRSFERWKDYVLMHLRSKIEDCQKLEVSPGIDD